MKMFGNQEVMKSRSQLNREISIDVWYIDDRRTLTVSRELVAKEWQGFHDLVGEPLTDVFRKVVKISLP